MFCADHIALLTMEEAVSVREKVRALHPAWIPRHPVLPAFTLGAAMYIDTTSGGFERYRWVAKKYNDLLWTHFEELYVHLQHVMEAYLGEPVEYSSRLAHPGFHIFLAHPALREFAPSVHQDLQFLDVEWHVDEGAEPQHSLSFTLAIEIPKEGAGMNVWPWRNTQLQDKTREHAVKLAQARPPFYVPYSVGGMVIHDGLNLHQITPPRSWVPSDQRISLQGHATRCRQGWVLYW
jgi:hypothetical protein